MNLLFLGASALLLLAVSASNTVAAQIANVTATTNTTATATATVSSTASSTPFTPIGPPKHAGCTNTYYRREIRDLSEAERTKLFAAMASLSKTHLSGSPFSITGEMANRHNNLNLVIHNVPVFLIWHRQFLLEYQQRLLSIDPTLVLPYWDWSIDAADPFSSVIFTSEYFGSSNMGCILDGAFANLPAILNTGTRCVQRGYTPGTKITFYSSSQLGVMTRAVATYDQFRQQLEYGPHGVPHNQIGGDMGSMYSPLDPLFMMHHGFVDKLFVDYQNAQFQRDGKLSYTSQADLSTILPGYTMKVSDILDSTALCYEYVNPSGNVPSNWNISLPPPLPDNWITMNGGNVTTVRNVESDLQKMNDQVKNQGASGNPPPPPGTSNAVVIKSGLLLLVATAVSTLFVL